MNRQYLLLIVIIIGFGYANKKMNSYLTAITNWEIPENITMHKVPILAFEFAENATDIQLIFQKQQEKKVEAFRKNTQVDFIYIFFYVSLFSLLAILFFPFDNKIKSSLIIMALLAGILDVIENIHLFRIMNHLGEHSVVDQLTASMWYFVWVKWILIGMIVIMLVFGILRLAFFRWTKSNRAS